MFPLLGQETQSSTPFGAEHSSVSTCFWTRKQRVSTPFGAEHSNVSTCFWAKKHRVSTPFGAEHSGVSTYFWAKKHRVSHTIWGRTQPCFHILLGEETQSFPHQTLRKLCGNFAETLRKLCGNSAETLQKICGNFKRNSAETRPKGLTTLELPRFKPVFPQTPPSFHTSVRITRPSFHTGVRMFPRSPR